MVLILGTDHSYVTGFPKIDNSGSSARIVLDQNKFIKKVPLIGIEPGTIGIASLLQSHAFPTVPLPIA